MESVETMKLFPNPSHSPLEGGGAPAVSHIATANGGGDMDTQHSNLLQLCNFSKTKQRCPATAIILNPSGDDL